MAQTIDERLAEIKNARHKVCYISIPRTVYEQVKREAKANCRSIGKELVFNWLRQHQELL